MANNLQAFTLQTAQVTTGTPETVCNDATPTNPLGAVMKYNDCVYRYVQSSAGTGTVATAAAGVAHWKTLTIGPNAGATTIPVWLVTGDQTDAIGGLSSVAGIYKGVVTTLYYTWIGIGGIHSCTTTTGTAAGDLMIGSVTDLTFGRVIGGFSAPGTVVYGVAYGAQSSTVNNVLLQNLIW